MPAEYIKWNTIKEKIRNRTALFLGSVKKADGVNGGRYLQSLVLFSSSSIIESSPSSQCKFSRPYDQEIFWKCSTSFCTSTFNRRKKGVGKIFSNGVLFSEKICNWINTGARISSVWLMNSSVNLQEVQTSNSNVIHIWSWQRLFSCTITEKSSVTFSLGGDNLKRYFDQR